MDAGDERYWTALIAWWLVSLLEVMLACAGERSGWLSFFAEWPGWCAVTAISPFLSSFPPFLDFVVFFIGAFEGGFFCFYCFFLRCEA